MLFYTLVLKFYLKKMGKKKKKEVEITWEIVLFEQIS